MRILVIGGISNSLISFRGLLLRAMLAKGHVILACSGEARSDDIKVLHGWGIQFAKIHMSRSGMKPWEDLRTLWDLLRLMRNYGPDLVLSYTIKPVIWAGIAAWVMRVSAIYSLITGLGYAFSEGNGIKRKIARFFAGKLYRLSLSKSRSVFFQNPDDLMEFERKGLVKKDKAILVNGSGVDLSHYALAPFPKNINFLMICRLIEDKGVREYIAAARIIKNRHPNIQISLAGTLDSNPVSVTRSELQKWNREGVVNYLGFLLDVRLAFQECSVYVLPSYYREGTPRTVLEAMSMGRPIITTNAPGCRETIKLAGNFRINNSMKLIQGENGFLVPVRNVDKIVDAMEKFIGNPSLIESMGAVSRKVAEEKYDVHKVNAVILRKMGIKNNKH